ncbi:MAG: hypothetical protein ACE5R6_15505 [Candidatus Heimdallarchaeota archaeon]
MEEICLDTDFIIGFLVGRPDTMLKLFELAIFGKQPITTAVNISELYRGITMRQWQEKRRAVLGRFVTHI